MRRLQLCQPWLRWRHSRGIQGITGQTFENYTVGQVMIMQRSSLFAVGRYQFIPSTLRWAVNHSSVDELDMFTPEVQDRLMATLVIYKRPAVGATCAATTTCWAGP